jgi:hypothetical protein
VAKRCAATPGHREKHPGCAGERYLALDREGSLSSRGRGMDDLVDKSRQRRCAAACAPARAGTPQSLPVAIRSLALASAHVDALRIQISAVGTFLRSVAKTLHAPS